MITALIKGGDFYLTQDDEETKKMAINLANLLNNGEEANQKLGLEIALGGGIHEIFFYDLLLIYAWNNNAEIQTLAAQVFEKFLPAETYKNLSYRIRAFNYNPTEDFIEYYLNTFVWLGIDGGKLGLKFYHKTGLGKRFCLNYSEGFVEICKEHTHNKALNLQNIKLKSINPNIETFEDLKYLYLQKNALGSIPIEITALQKLQILNLQKNNLKTFPKYVLKLPNLHLLNLSQNKIKKIPAAIPQLESLAHLDLSKNKIVDFPEQIGQLKKLTYLNLFDNPIAKNEEKIQLLKSLLPQCHIFYELAKTFVQND